MYYNQCKRRRYNIVKQKIINEVLIERLNLLKEEKGFALDVIEEAVGISKGSMSKYMSGIHLPNSEVIRKLSIYWNVSSDYLLGSSNDRGTGMSDGKSIPNGYVSIIKEAIEAGITEDEFRGLLEMAKKFKRS
jgi:transcriptional regulator with XRE-family HTH domain